jgi:DNA-directed RNA polymerase specialized sigma subunit
MIQEILDDYGFWEELIRKKNREIERLRERKLSITVNNDGLPRSTARYTMEDYMADMETLEADLKELQSRQLEAYDRICRLLVTLRSVRHREVIYLRYVDLLSWREIRSSMRLSRTRCYDLHREALELLEKRGVQDSDPDV